MDMSILSTAQIESGRLSIARYFVYPWWAGTCLPSAPRSRSFLE